MQTDKNLDGFILNLLKDENNRDASVLHQIINIIFTLLREIKTDYSCI